MTESPDTVLARLQSSDVRQRSTAVLQLQPGTAYDAAAIAALVQVVSTDADLSVVEDATWVLVRHGEAAVSALLAALTQDGLPASTRHNIVHALGKLADARAVPALITATTDPESTVRLKAVYALGQVGDVQAVDTLIHCLDDPVQNVSWTAREVLEGFGDQALPHLIQGLTLPSAQVRELCANLLGDTADARAVDPLIAALDTDDWQVRFAIVEALGAIGDIRALPVVDSLVNDPQPQLAAIAKNVSKRLNKGAK